MNPNEAKNEQEEEQPSKTPIEKMEQKTKKEEEDIIKSMCLDDKLVPERFAACKRVPKTLNLGNPRDYASSYVEIFHNNTDGGNDGMLKKFKNVTKEMLQ